MQISNEESHQVGPTIFVGVTTLLVMIGLLYSLGVVASVVGGLVTLAVMGVMFNNRG
jgi:hypothetical protein